MGHYVSTLTMLPQTTVHSGVKDPEFDAMDVTPGSSYQVLVTSQSGSVGLVTTVLEECYRRLTAMQSQLINALEHPCGLNPRAFRAVESDGIGGRGLLDGNLLRRWLDLGIQRKAEIAGRVGTDIWTIRSDLEAASDGGLGYL